MLAVAGIGAAGATGRNIIASIVSYRFGARLRVDLFRRVTSFSFGEMNTFDASSLITRQTNDVTQVQNFVNGVMRFFAKAPILAVGGLVMAIILEPGLSIVLAVAVPIAALLIVLNLATGFPRFRRVQEGLDGVNSVTREYLGGIRVVKAFGQERHEVGKFAEANGELTGRPPLSPAARWRCSDRRSRFSMNVGIVAVLWIGGYRVASSSLQVGKIIAFINYMSQILFSLNVLSMVFTSLVRARASWERITEVLATPASEDLEPAQAVSPDGPFPAGGRGARVAARRPERRSGSTGSLLRTPVAAEPPRSGDGQSLLRARGHHSGYRVDRGGQEQPGWRWSRGSTSPPRVRFSSGERTFGS